VLTLCFAAYRLSDGAIMLVVELVRARVVEDNCPNCRSDLLLEAQSLGGLPLAGEFTWNSTRPDSVPDLQEPEVRLPNRTLFCGSLPDLLDLQDHRTTLFTHVVNTQRHSFLAAKSHRRRICQDSRPLRGAHSSGLDSLCVRMQTLSTRRNVSQYSSPELPSPFRHPPRPHTRPYNPN
jgi:hypothetical protein